MPVIFGWMAGDLIGRVLVSRVVLTFAMWFAIAILGYKIGVANISPMGGSVLSILLPGTLLAWALVRPAASRVKIWLVEGMLVMIFAAQVWHGGKAAFRFIGNGFRLSQLGHVVAPLLVVAALWGVRTALLAWVRRSDERLGARSVLRHA